MILYADIINEVALRVNAVNGATAAAKETSFAANPLTAAQIGSVDFPLSSIQRNVLAGVGRIVRTYANLKNHPFRLYNASQTANIPSGGAIPFTDLGNKPIVGVYGAIRDSITHTPLTEQPLQLIETINRSVADGSLKLGYFYYKIVDGRIVHTRPNVQIDVVTFDAAAETAKIKAADGVSPLPDALFDLGFSAAPALMVSDDAYYQQAAMYENYVQNELANMANGAIAFKPAPTLVNSDVPSVS